MANILDNVAKLMGEGGRGPKRYIRKATSKNDYISKNDYMPRVIEDRLPYMARLQEYEYPRAVPSDDMIDSYNRFVANQPAPYLTNIDEGVKMELPNVDVRANEYEYLDRPRMDIDRRLYERGISKYPISIDDLGDLPKGY